MTAADKPILTPTPAATPLQPLNSSCGCDTGKGGNNFKWSDKLPPYILGEYQTGSGIVPRIQGKLTWRDHLGSLHARLSNYRMKYRVEPGLYALGSPDSNSPVAVTANYKMSFDALRKNLQDRDIWILVLNTAGINVWCAAGKGTFGTGELIKKIEETALAHVVTHRSVIIPQLGAPGINAALVKKATGFHIHFGPVMARDLPSYLSGRMTAEPAMRRIPFTAWDRLVLTPMELNPAIKKFIPVGGIILAFLGLTPEGIIFSEALSRGGPFVFQLLIAVIIGAFMVPLLLPLLPFRAFSLKGLSAGLPAAGLMLFINHQGSMPPLLSAAAFIMTAVFSSYLALMFTGSTTFTNISGVKKEMRIAIPVYVFLAAVSGILLVLSKVQQWGLI